MIKEIIEINKKIIIASIFALTSVSALSADNSPNGYFSDESGILATINKLRYQKTGSDSLKHIKALDELAYRATKNIRLDETKTYYHNKVRKSMLKNADYDGNYGLIVGRVNRIGELEKMLKNKKKFSKANPIGNPKLSYIGYYVKRMNIGYLITIIFSNTHLHIDINNNITPR